VVRIEDGLIVGEQRGSAVLDAKKEEPRAIHAYAQK
jgi:hypothetical protein